MNLLRIHFCLYLLLLLFPHIIYSSDLSLPINALPMYGDVSKSPEQNSADKEFIEQSIQKAGSREKATLQLLDQGWSFLMQGDFTTSMKRFNQAWLLSPDNYEVYWGFGANLARSGKYDESIRLYQKALDYGPVSARFLSDSAEPYLGKAELAKDGEIATYADKAISLCQEALEIDPKLGGAYFNWAVALYYKGEFQDSFLKVNKALELDKFCVNEAFVKELKTKLKD